MTRETMLRSSAVSDETPVPETLETIAAKIAALGQSIDARFAQVDARFAQVDTRFAQVDARFDEQKAQLRVEIEAVNANVMRVYDAVIAQQKTNATNDDEHRTIERHLDDHEIRIIALERDKRKTV